MGNFEVPGVPGEVCWRYISGRGGSFVELGSLVLTRALAGFGFGFGVVRVGAVGVGAVGVGAVRVGEVGWLTELRYQYKL